MRRKLFPALIAVFLVISLLTLGACKNKKKTGDDAQTDAVSTDASTSESAQSTQEATDTTAPVTTAPADTTAAVTQPPAESTTASTTAPATTAPAETTTAAPATTQPEQTTTAAADYSGWGNTEILNYLSAAINKTKGYTAAITVNHKESFTSTVTNLSPGGALMTQAVNFVKDLVLKPTEEVYSFSGGLATTSEGETTQLLLPKDAAFSLPPEGVANATITQEGALTHVVLTLASESVDSLSAVPRYNASAIGYLNLDGKFKVIQIQELTISYPGSIIDAYVRADGYVDSVTYTIKLDAYSKAKGMGITGTANFNGDQVEVWQINW